MADKMLVEVADGVAEYLVFDDSEGKVGLLRTADAEPVIDRNKAKMNDGSGGWSKSKDLRRVADIPVTIQFEWIQRYGADPLARGNEDLLRRLLNDPEWMYLRTAPGRV